MKVKKSMGIVMLLAVLLAVGACGNKLEIDSLAPSAYGELQNTGIVMHLVEETVTTKTDSITVAYVNNTDTQVLFDEEPLLEIASEGNWYVVPTKQDAAWHDISHTLPPKETVEMAFPLSSYYEALVPGHYRIVKPFYADGEKLVAAVAFEMQ